jgi:hypothetical protein
MLRLLSLVTLMSVASAATAAEAPPCQLPPNTKPFEFVVGSNKLRGFVDAPAEGTKHPVVVIAKGSGPTNVTGPAGYPQLRDALRSAGVATVIWDRAGDGCSTGSYAAPTDLYGLAEELRVALDVLSRRPDIDPRRIGAWGISQAGWVVPMAAARSPHLAFFVLVSVPARDMLGQIRYVVQSQLQLSGVPAEQAREAAAVLDRASAVAAAGGSYEEYSRAVEPLRKYPLLRQLTITEGTPEQYRAGQQSGSQLVSVDRFLPALNGPVLAIFGDRDTLVDWRESMQVYPLILRAAGNDDVTIELFKGADHNMHRARTGSIEEMQNRSSNEYVAGYLQTIVSWLRARGFSGAPASTAR